MAEGFAPGFAPGNGTPIPICSFGIAGKQEQLCSDFVTTLCSTGNPWACGGAIAAVLLADLVDFIIGEFAGRPTMAATQQIAGYAKDKNPILRTLGWGAAILGARGIPISSSSGASGSFGPYFTTAVFLLLTYNRNAMAPGAAHQLSRALHEMGNKAGVTITELRQIVNTPITIKSAKTNDKQRTFTLQSNSKISQILAFACQQMIGPNQIAGFTCPSPPTTSGGGGGGGAGCASGLTFDPTSQTCTPSPSAGNCPAGYTYTALSNSCTPVAYAGGGTIGGGGSYSDSNSPYQGGDTGSSPLTDAGAATASSSAAPASPYAPMSFSVGPDTVTYPPLTLGGPGPYVTGPDIGGGSYAWPDGGITSFGPTALSRWSMQAPMNFVPTRKATGGVLDEFPSLAKLLPKAYGIGELADGAHALATGQPLSEAAFGALAGGLIGLVAGPFGVASGALIGVTIGAIVGDLSRYAQKHFGRNLDSWPGLLNGHTVQNNGRSNGGQQVQQAAGNTRVGALQNASDFAQQGHATSVQQPRMSASQGAPQMGQPLQRINFADQQTAQPCPSGWTFDEADGRCRPLNANEQSGFQPTAPMGASCTPCEQVRKALESCADCGEQPLQVGTTSINPSTGQPEFHPMQGVDPLTHQRAPLEVKPTPVANPITVCFTCESDNDLALALSGQANHCQLTATQGGSATAAASNMMQVH